MKLGFGTLPTGVSEGTTDETTVSITDDDDPQVTVSFGASTYTAAEGSTSTVTVTLSADPERTVEVQITTTNQGGASAADYSGVPASVTFNAGETSQPITFAATQDTEDDDGESVLLAFGALPTGVTAGATDETTVSIRDDDDPQVTVQLRGQHVHGGGGEHGHGDGDAERGPGADGRGPDHHDQPGRRERRRLLPATSPTTRVTFDGPTTARRSGGDRRDDGHH